MKKRQLILLHFAGGNHYSFQFLLPWLKDFHVLVPELPGRGRRHGEELLRDFDLAAADIFRQVIRWLDTSPFIIYGHSMGAYLALKVANLLEQTGRCAGYIVVSGNAGPGIRDGKNRHLLQGHAFIRELECLGGVPREVLDDKELFSFFEPVLRADFELAEMNALEQEPPSGAPLYALMGSIESRTDKIANWGRFTRRKFNSEIWEGDHFFIHNYPDRLAALFLDCSRTGME